MPLPLLLARPRRRRWLATPCVLLALSCLSGLSVHAHDAVPSPQPVLLPMLQAPPLSPASMQCSTALHTTLTCSWADRQLMKDDSDPVLQLVASSLEQLADIVGVRQDDNTSNSYTPPASLKTPPPPSASHLQTVSTVLQPLSAGPLLITTAIAAPPTPSTSKAPSKTAHKATPTATVSSAAQQGQQPQHERHIPSYEQWRKQILEKQNKPAEQLERKQRRRKPFQESTVDVAVGEDELGFPFSNLEGSQQRRDGAEQDASLARQLGDGPDLSKATNKETTWVKAEYAKDPKDRFNHASATCAASVVKATKDAKSITAILNEGKDNYMLYKCDTKDKYFVVELCEEILVDTFVLGNYEFFSSTFKEFVVSVNRYPPRDDGWSVLGHFLARNSRDAQVFKPAVPQLATYIRFDFLSHYGREFYCPVTLLRVYGATALEQLKQEEEEEKRQLMEQQRIREALKAEERAREAEEAEGHESEEEEEEDDGKHAEGTEKKGSQQMEMQDTVDQEVEIHEPASTPTITSTTTVTGVSQGNGQPSLDNIKQDHSQIPQHTEDRDSSVLSPSAPDAVEGSSTNFVLSDGVIKPKKEAGDDENSHVQEEHTLDPKPTSDDEEATIRLEHPETADATGPFPRLSPTSPASMQDDPEWHQSDLGVITIPQKVKPSYLPKPSNHKPSGTGQTHPNGGGSVPGENASGHPHPTPASSQESVYKNIVNRLKALELNASLSHQYLEEQSNVFNDVLQGLEDTSSQLITHLNEANKRLESLGRKYDQLAYSFKAHLDIDSSRTKAEVKDLSSQLHALAAQVVFQRQLFVIAILVLCAIFAFFAVTRNTTLPYTIVQSPLGAKWMAISGERRDRFLRRVRNNLINPELAVGASSSPQPPLPPMASHRNSLSVSKFSTDLDKRSDEMSESVYTPPMSPISPMPPASHTGGGQGSGLDDILSPRVDMTARCSRAGSLASLVASAQRLEDSIRESNSGDRDGDGTREGDTSVTYDPKHDLTTPEQRARVAYEEYLNATNQSPQDASPDRHASETSPQFHSAERFLLTRTPYPTPKNGCGGSIGNADTLDTSHRTMSFRQHDTVGDFRPESPSFQMLSTSSSMIMDGGGSIDVGHLSDADVAYLSRDMNVSRIDSSSPTPLTPIMASEPRIMVSPIPTYSSSSSYTSYSGHSPRPPSTIRPSALRNETTMSLQSNATLEQTSDEMGARPGDDTDGEKQDLHTSLQESALDMHHHLDTSSSSSYHLTDPQGTSASAAQRFLAGGQKQALLSLEQQANEQDEDQGFVSDSVIEGSKSDILRSSDDEGDRGRRPSATSQESRPSVSLAGEWDRRHGAGENLLSLPDHRLDHLSSPAATEKNTASNKSRRRSSHSGHRSLPDMIPQEVADSKNKSVSGILGLGLGLDVQEEEEEEGPTKQQRQEGSLNDPLCVPSISQSAPSSEPWPTRSKGGDGGSGDGSEEGGDHTSIEAEKNQTAPTIRRSSSISSSRSAAQQNGQNGGGRSADPDRGDEGGDEGSPVMDRRAQPSTKHTT